MFPGSVLSARPPLGTRDYPEGSRIANAPGGRQERLWIQLVAVDCRLRWLER